ncbi:MAG: SMI1/KNR4 family protein [Tepidisphaeraceae bacterium]
MREFKELGVKPYGKRRPFAAFADDVLHEFEVAFDIRLPHSYVQFLRFSNGGALELAEFDDPVSGAVGGITNFYGLGSREDDETAAREGRWDFGSLWSETRAFRQYQFSGRAVPIGENDCGDRVFLDFQVEPPRISQFFASTKATYPLASTFEKFLDMLHEKTPLPHRGAHKVRLNLEKPPKENGTGAV